MNYDTDKKNFYGGLQNAYGICIGYWSAFGTERLRMLVSPA
jgi:hypothetical protein